MQLPRRILLPLLCIGVLSLTACRPLGPLPPPEEALRRAVLNSMLSESIVVSASGSYTLFSEDRSVHGNFLSSGTVADGGRMLSLAVHLDVGTGSSIDAHLTATGDGFLYVQPSQASDTLAQSEVMALGGGSLRHVPFPWFSRSSAGSQDIRFVDRILSALRISDDFGLEQADGTYLRHVRVAGNIQSPPQTGTGATVSDIVLTEPSLAGDVWIDATSFHLQQVRWHIRSVTLGTYTVDGDLELHYRDFNRAPPVAAPVGSSVPLSPDAIFAIFSL